MYSTINWQALEFFLRVFYIIASLREKLRCLWPNRIRTSAFCVKKLETADCRGYKDKKTIWKYLISFIEQGKVTRMILHKSNSRLQKLWQSGMGFNMECMLNRKGIMNNGKRWCSAAENEIHLNQQKQLWKQDLKERKENIIYLDTCNLWQLS